MNIIIFGTGFFGRKFKRYCETSKEYNVVAAVDNRCEVGETIEWEGIQIVNPINIRQYDFDQIVITVKDLNIAEAMKKQLQELGVLEDRTICAFENKEILSKILSVNEYKENDVRVNWVKAFSKFVEEENLSGNVAECGVYWGDFSMYMNQFFANKKLYMFDTFEGFPENDLETERKIANPAFLTGEFNQTGVFSGTSADIVLRRMPHKEQCVIRKGYFPETAVGLEKEQFCFVNLDMDLYKPQLEGLRFFYDRMVVGGVILLHDYYDPQLPGVRSAVDEFLKERKNESISKFPIGDNWSIAIMKR